MRFQCIVDKGRYNVHMNMFKFVKYTYHKPHNELKVVKVGLWGCLIRGTNTWLIKRSLLKHLGAIKFFGSLLASKLVMVVLVL
jgi:hypothetical protein